MDKQERSDLQYLMGREEFLRFLARAIQTAGILSQGSNGHDGRDLAFVEGRRSLGFWMLGQANAGLPDVMQSSDNLAALHAIVRAQIQSPKMKDKRDDRPSRYDELNDPDE